MCGLPLFPPKPKQEDPARARRAFPRIATWERGEKSSNPISKEAHADRPRGEPLFDPASWQSTPVERTGLFLKSGGEPR